MIDRDALAELKWKYETLLALKTEREAAVARGELRFSEVDASRRRATMQRLAHLMPGSLRELDGATLAELQARLGEVDRALSFGVVERWMIAATLFHQRLRLVLHARRQGAWARPKSGRVLDEVWTDIGLELGTTAHEAERLVHPRARARHARE